MGGDSAFIILVFIVLNTVLAESKCSFKYLDPGERLGGGRGGHQELYCHQSYIVPGA